MIDEISVLLGQGEEWWRRLSTAQKASILLPYFEADGELGFLKQQKRNQELADALKIHVSSVSLQHRRYWMKKTGDYPAQEAEVVSPEERYRSFLSKLPPGVRHPPKPTHMGLAWWKSTSPAQKCATVGLLAEQYGLSMGQIALYLDLPSRCFVSGARNRLSKRQAKLKLLVDGESP